MSQSDTPAMPVTGTLNHVRKTKSTPRKTEKNQITTVMTEETADTDVEEIWTRGCSVAPVVGMDMYHQGVLKA